MGDLSPALLLSAVSMVALLGILAAAEAAFNDVGPHRLRKLTASNGNGNGDSEAGDLEQFSHVYTSLVAGRVLLLVGFGSLATISAWTIAPGWQSVALSLALGSLILMIVEIVARQSARVYSEAVSRVLWKPLVNLSRLLYPLVLVPLWLSRPFVPAAGRTTHLATHLEEIHDEIQRLQVEGVIENDESQIIQSVFEFGETIAKEVMVPRVDMVCVQLGSPLHQVLDLMINCGYTRLPVYEENVDQILGLVNAKDLLKKVEEIKASVLSRENLREILFVPGTKKIPKVLRDLQRNRITMAIVVDEYGGTDGLLTLEDIVEEIVGEITDEYDQANEGVQMLKDGSAIVDAKMVLEDVNSYVGLDLPVDEHETLGGYVFGLFGRVPRALESVDVDELRLTVESIQRQRITRVRIQKVAPPEAVLAG